MKFANEYIEDLEKANKAKEYKEVLLKNSLLKNQINSLNSQLDEKDVTIQNLITQIKKDSTNSSKPSSTDNIYKKRFTL